MSISKQTEQYIRDHPSIKDCVKNGLINYSALARQICDELSIESFDAVLIACRRYFWKLEKENVHEDEIMDLMKTSKIRVRNKILVAIIDKPRNLERISRFKKKVKRQKGDFNLIEGEDVAILITNSLYKKEIEQLFKLKLIKINDNLVQITMIFDPKIETTPGTVNFVYGLLAEHGINVWEEMSCWTDIMIVIDEKDVGKAMQVLSF